MYLLPAHKEKNRAMNTIWTIAWKDTLIRFRDRNALLLMFAAPLVLSAIIGSAFGSFITDQNVAPLRNIPLIIINADEGERGQQFLTAVTTSDELTDLLEPTVMTDLNEARRLVSLGETRAVVYIPPDFTAALERDDEATSTIQLYTDAGATISPFIIQIVMTRIAREFSEASISASVTLSQLREHSVELEAAMADLEGVLNNVLQTSMTDEGTVAASELNWESAVAVQGDGVNITNPLAFFAPSMGVLFLTFTMMAGARTILTEEVMGTLDRLLSTPASRIQVLLGKVGGNFLTGILQFVIFVFASGLLFSLSWGHSVLGLALVVVATVAAFTSLGIFIATITKDAGQAASWGGAVILIFAALGGNLVPAENYSGWLDILSKLTINRWSMDAFVKLTIQGMDLPDVLVEIAVLLILAVVFFVLAGWQFERRIAR